MKSLGLLLPVCLGLCLNACASEDAPAQATTQNFTEQDFGLEWLPEAESDWDIVPMVKTFQAEAPSRNVSKIDNAPVRALRAGVSTSYTQRVEEVLGEGTQRMSVHITRIVVEVPYDDFVKKLPVEQWGPNLDHYLGGEIKVYETDEEGRATRQLERMTLSPMPCNINSKISNNDMTKVEVIEYGDDWATVYWHVRDSKNNSTESDVGSVDFRATQDGAGTIITFHSAHRLNALGGIHIASLFAKPAIESTFLDFVRHYAELVSP